MNNADSATRILDMKMVQYNIVAMGSSHSSSGRGGANVRAGVNTPFGRASFLSVAVISKLLFDRAIEALLHLNINRHQGYNI